MNIKQTVSVFAMVVAFALSSCSGELKSENAQLKKDLAESQAQLKEQTKLSNFSKEQATTANRRADEAEKELAKCNEGR